MIIWGSRGISSSVGSGQFHCPRCGPQRNFNHVAVNRWFTLYFIPVFPIGKAGEYLECQSCSGTFGMEAMHYDPERERQKANDEIKRILVLAAMAQGAPTDDTYTALIHVYADLADVYLQRSELEREVALAQSAGAQLSRYVRGVASQFTTKGKHMIMASAYAVLCPSGGVTARAEAVLRELGTALQLSAGDVQVFLSGGAYSRNR